MIPTHRALITVVLSLSIISAKAQGVHIGESVANPNPSAMLEVESSNRGFLPPRLSSTERDGIADPAEGLVIFNLTVHCLEYFSSGQWYSLCGTCPGPQVPASDTHFSDHNQITWNWNEVEGATGYKVNTSNVYVTATDLGQNTQYLQTGLTCEQAYSIFVWAYNSCGVSPALELQSSTTSCPFVCGQSVTFIYKGSQVTYGTVQSQGKCWMDRNLGASQVATSTADPNAYGDLFQWGRGDDGHQNTNSPTTSTLSSTDNPGNNQFIYSNGGDWRNPANDNLWQGASGVNNPCPAGWRVPDNSDLNTERLGWSSQNAAGAFASPLKWTRSGYRYYQTGALQVQGNQSYAWSSTVDSPGFGSILFFDASSASLGEGGYYRAGGMSVRCIKD